MGSFSNHREFAFSEYFLAPKPQNPPFDFPSGDARFLAAGCATAARCRPYRPPHRENIKRRKVVPQKMCVPPFRKAPPFGCWP